MLKKIRYCLLITAVMTTLCIASPVVMYQTVCRPHYVMIYPGSLRANVSRLSKTYGWPQMIWNLPNDYQWVGYVKVAGNNLPDILRNLLLNYPLQANFYQGNHVLVIQPRTLQS